MSIARFKVAFPLRKTMSIAKHQMLTDVVNATKVQGKIMSIRLPKIMIRLFFSRVVESTLEG